MTVEDEFRANEIDVQIVIPDNDKVTFKSCTDETELRTQTNQVCRKNFYLLIVPVVLLLVALIVGLLRQKSEAT